MPTAVAENIGKKTKAYAMEVEKEILALASEMGPRYWKMGLLAVDVKEKALWQVRGFESESKYQQFLRVGRSNWFRTRRLSINVAVPLMDAGLLTRRALDRLTLDNAEQLLRLPEKLRLSQKWVEMALTMTEDEFEAKVDHVVENDEDESTLGEPESIALLKIRCTASQKTFILDSFKEFAKSQKPPLALDDHGGILEKMAASWMAGLRESEE